MSGVVRLRDWSGEPAGEMPEPAEGGSGLALHAEPDGAGRARVRVSCRLPETVRNHLPAPMQAVVLHASDETGAFAAAVKLRNPDVEPGDYVPNFVAAPKDPGHPKNSVRFGAEFAVELDPAPAGRLFLHLSLLDRLSPVVELALRAE